MLLICFCPPAVIDFCLTKNLVCDPDTNFTQLQVEWASKANCTQRKGRAGRVSNGRVYFMVTRSFFENCLPDYGIPEMQVTHCGLFDMFSGYIDVGMGHMVIARRLSSSFSKISLSSYP